MLRRLVLQIQWVEEEHQVLAAVVLQLHLLEAVAHHSQALEIGSGLLDTDCGQGSSWK